LGTLAFSDNFTIFNFIFMVVASSYKRAVVSLDSKSLFTAGCKGWKWEVAAG
jgi:hypothetical protein